MSALIAACVPVGTASPVGPVTRVNDSHATGPDPATMRNSWISSMPGSFPTVVPPLGTYISSSYGIVGFASKFSVTNDPDNCRGCDHAGRTHCPDVCVADNRI